ncbi:hypothetical protein A5733_04285 [Mycobacterium sp. NS-7484]|uniref:hypothetical protein n=1 Tax=Mycobacterium sp. NS-7484 TaxID=1834161 RepID=UPI00096EB7B5|nr:hypothetical protein [Mycobacterium sp. NS-7484]OMC00335.1 hypothetical protein A5733_04285 [Mycobacterium sp. NS-7484]
MLDTLRRQQETLLANKPRYMLLARRYGFADAEIAELLGMTESGVRKAIRRTEGTPGAEFGDTDRTVTAYVTRDSLRVFAGGTEK